MRKNDWLIYILFFLITLLITFPSILFLSKNMIGDTGDGYQFLSFQYIAKREIFAGHFPLAWSNFWRYPYGINAQNIIDSNLLTYIGVILYSFSSNPILVYNISVLALVFLNLVITYASFRIFFERLPSLIGAIIYGLSFYSIGKLGGHMNLYSLSGFALFIFSFIKLYITEGELKYFILTGVSLILIAFASLQYPLFFIGSLPVIVPVLILFYPKQSHKFFKILAKRKYITFITLAAVLGIFMLFNGQKLTDLFHGTVPFPVSEISTVPIQNFFIPNKYLHVFMNTYSNNSKEWIEYVVAFGYVELVLFILAAIFLPNTKLKYFLLTVTVLIFIVALGKQNFLEPLWPYQYLFKVFPYRGIIEPGRFFIIYSLFSTFLIVLFVRRIKDNMLLGIIAALLIVERLPTDFRLSPNQYDKQFVQKVQEPPSSAILDLPIYTDWWNGQMYDIYSVYYRKPIVNGYVQWSGDSPESQTLVKKLEPYTCYPDPLYAPKDFDYNRAVSLRDELVREMKFYDIRTIVIHKDLNLNDEQCVRAKKYIQVLMANQDQWLTIYDSKNQKVLWLKE